MGTLIVNQYLNKLWTPAEMATALWLDAADSSSITTVNGNVSQWNDLSGNNRNATQSDANKRPIYTLSGLNSKSVLTFSQDELSVPGLILTGQGWDVFVVASLKNTSNSFARLLSLRENGQVKDFDNPGSWLPVYRDAVTSQIGSFQNSSETTLFSVVYDEVNIINSRINNGLVFFVNGLQAGTKAVSYNLNTTDGLLIGQSLFSNDENWDGIVAEIIFTTTPADILRQKIEGYLAHKWGLAANLPVTHPYKNTPPYV